jgi:hypothetical protein
MADSDQQSFAFDKPKRRGRPRKEKQLPETLAQPADADEPWLHDVRPFFCPTVKPYHAEVSGYVLPDPGGRPDELFVPRSLAEVPRLPGSYSLSGAKPKLYLPVDKRREAEMLAAGAVKGPRGGFYVDMDRPSHMLDLGRLQAFVPFIAKPLTRAFQVEPIPSTSWGATLANLLTKTSWERLRLRATHHFSHLCQICGEGSRKTIEVHELWTYEMPKRRWDPGMQRLVGLLSLCGKCHRCFHPGFAAILGRGAEAVERLGLVNRWTRAETEGYLDWAGSVWQARSTVPWALDLGLIDGEELVVSSANWVESEDGRLFPRKDGAQRGTRILNARWSATKARDAA